MKKLILTLVTALLFNLAGAQTTYKAVRAEWYVLNEQTDKWEVQSINKDININIVAYKDIVNIQAQAPTLYRISNRKNNEIEDFVGYRYDAIEYVGIKKCTLDIMKMKNDNSDIFVISIIVQEQGNYINLRYFATTN
jgi:predicted transglutaminase-like cysteine proteinase